MKILLEGLRKFSSDVYPEHKDLFQKLSNGQKPHTLMITCSDSRIDPNLVTQTEPGEIFVIRNAGNIIPPFGSSQGGEEAAIEFAIEALKVSNIVICGHTHCGAMSALMNHDIVKDLPSVASWLDHAAATRRRCKDHTDKSAIKVVEENVLVQAENLKSHPAVSAGLGRKSLQIYGWVYHFETGKVTIYDPTRGEYVLSSDVKSRADSDLKSLAI
jgi:carbonic anhydrase